jgi:lactate dehydrogenase-like 2-hydroxyacid dehydrogenase
MKIVVLDAKTLGNVPNIHDIGRYGQVEIHETTSPGQTAERISDAEIIVTNKVVINAGIMDQCKNLQLICVSATGMNNIDLLAAKERGIAVKNAVGYSSESVAQHTFAMIFQLTNQIGYYDAYVKSGDYAQSEIFTHYGPASFELFDKQYGIIGMGNIGQTVAKIAEAFGAKVRYYSTTGKNHHQHYQSTTLRQLLETSDIISIHAPLNTQTQNLIGKKELQAAKPTAILVNVGRGGIVEEDALAAAIDAGQIGGACIDVYENEPLEASSPLLKVRNADRLVLSPHNAWASVEARIRLVAMVVDNIADFVSGKDQ